MPAERRGGSKRRVRPRRRSRLQGLREQHGEAARASLGRLARGKAASLMSASVAAIALALPLGLAVMIHNAAGLTGATRGSAAISVFLRHGSDSADVAGARRAAAALPNVSGVRVITPDEALARFKQRPAFSQALSTLKANPLPPVLVVTPRDTSPAKVKVLAAALDKISGADQIVSDTQWVERLNAMLAVARRALWVIGVLLAIAVLLIIGNTIRLEIQGRRREIEVQKLVGATNAFVRRPFLYGGLWYGAIGGVLAWILVEIALAILAHPVARLAHLYAGQGGLAGPGASGFFAMLAIGAALGWLGALLAVGRYLRAVEPG